jgi:hypothetical protein
VLVAAGAGVALLAVGLALRAERAGAAFPGTNGKIVFDSFRDGNRELYVMEADGQNQTNVTNHGAGDIDPGVLGRRPQDRLRQRP